MDMRSFFINSITAVFEGLLTFTKVFIIIVILTKVLISLFNLKVIS